MEEEKQSDRWQKFKLSEDWISVIVGLGLVLFVWLGIITQIPWPLFGLFE